MEAPNELEKFIHAQLQKLPEREAPENLARNVLAAIQARKNLPWWKQPFTGWPRAVQSVLFVALLLILAGVLYGTGRAADSLPMPDFSGKVPSLGWIGTTVRSVGEALFLAVGSLSLQWLLVIGVIFALLYAACLATGFALFKVAGRASSHPA